MHLRIVRRLIAAAGGLLLLAAAPPPGLPQFTHWIDGMSPDEPTMQVQRIDADTFVIRQSVKTNFEAPFLYLLFGRDSALLLDSGAGGLAIRPEIERLIAAWREAHGGRRVRLIVAHSHSHGDHHAGDDEFRDRPDTEVIGLSPAAVAKAFHVAGWPRGLGHINLGGRNLDVIPTPGHEPAHIMIYDARTRLLFSGDMLYPGRLYVPVDQFGVFRASVDRLVAFSARHSVRALLGAHIEMTNTPGLDYAMEASTHPAEHVLPLRPETILQLQSVVHAEGANPVIVRRADFILFPRPAAGK